MDRFHYSPLARDVLDIMWNGLLKAVREGNVEDFTKHREAIEQYAAKTVRDYARRGEWNGNAPKGGV